MDYRKKYLKYKSKYINHKKMKQDGGGKAKSTIKGQFMFANASNIYKQIDKDYTKHENGYVIIAPPGAGKSYFVRNLNNNNGKKKDFIDGDLLLPKLGVNWKIGKFPEPDFVLSYKRADLMLEQSRQYGYRILTSTFFEFNGDALVLPKIKDHKELVKKRKDLTWNYVLQLRKRFEWFAKNYYNTPIFETFDEAIEYLNKKKPDRGFLNRMFTPKNKCPY